MIKKWWDKISFLGLEDLDKNDALFRFREVILINRLIVVLTLIMLIFIPFELIVHGADLLHIIIIEILLMNVTLILNKRKLYSWARGYMFFMSVLVVGPLLFFVPQEANNQYLLLPVSLIPVILFKRKTAVIGGFIFVVISYFFIEHTRGLVPDIVSIPEEKLHIFSDVFILMVFIVLFMLLYYFKAINTDYETIIGERNADLKKSHEIISEKNKEITDSITYAKRLQEAILPPEQFIKTHLPESFIFYKPKDIVAGDFYWMEIGEANKRSSEVANKQDSKIANKLDSEIEMRSPSGAEVPDSNKHILFAAADCTGHGVPGAMVSVVCHNALNRSLKEFGLTEPGKILDKTKELVVETFTKSNTDVKDGMDISLCSIRYQVESIKTKENSNFEISNSKCKAILQWAGANNPLWVARPNRTPSLPGRQTGEAEVRGETEAEMGPSDFSMLRQGSATTPLEMTNPEGQSGTSMLRQAQQPNTSVTDSSQFSHLNTQYSLQELKADKQPIGKTHEEKPFTTHTLELQKGDIVFLFTDGFADQFGGEKGKKFMYKPMKELLLKNASLPMEKQKELLQEAFSKWTNTEQNSFDQVDDICIIGIKI